MVVFIDGRGAVVVLVLVGGLESKWLIFGDFRSDGADLRLQISGFRSPGSPSSKGAPIIK